MGQGDTAGAGRKSRLARAELRSMLLEAALEILREEGLHTGSVNITFKRVSDRVRVRTGIQVTNGSVIKRIWENQAEFQATSLWQWRTICPGRSSVSSSMPSDRY